MQGLQKTAVILSQSMYHGAETFISRQSPPLLRCVCRFKSTTNTAQQIISQGTLASSTGMASQSSLGKSKLLSKGWCFTLQQKSLVTISSDKTLNVLSCVSPGASKDNCDIKTVMTFTSLLPYQSHLLQSNHVTHSLGQLRHISNHTKRRSQRKEASRTLSTQKDEQNSSDLENKKGSDNVEADETKSLTLYQRFKKTYKEHGKVLIGVHLVTSAAWFGMFYTAARCGIDIVPYLESWNFSDKVIAPFRSGGLGDIALAYLMYKLMTPARYTVTIGGTNLAIRYLRKEGRMQPVPEGDTLRELYKEGKEGFKDRSRQRMNNIRRMRNRIPRRRNRGIHKDPKDR